jgi:hypothetical protein
MNNLPYFLVKKVDDKSVAIGHLKDHSSFFGASDGSSFFFIMII